MIEYNWITTQVNTVVEHGLTNLWCDNAKLNNVPSGSTYYRSLGFTVSGGDRYFLLIDSSGRFFTGVALNGVSTITWREK